MIAHLAMCIPLNNASFQIANLDENALSQQRSLLLSCDRGGLVWATGDRAVAAQGDSTWQTFRDRGFG